MARYTGPKCKICRREGVKLYLKGSRCSSEKCPLTTRNFPPGQHGNARRRRISDYGRHLREKQKVKKTYGLLETQFKKYYEKAERVDGITGETLLQMLEQRLDNIVYSSGLGVSRSQARQIVGQGKIRVNEKVVTIPSYQVKSGDLVQSEFVNSMPKDTDDMPEWMAWDSKKNAVQVSRLPTRDDIDEEINEQLIVEYYSR